MSLFSDKGQGLTDLELALFLSLVANEHCIIQTEEESLGQLTHELQLIASNVFDLACALVRCGVATTLDDLSAGILVKGRNGPAKQKQEQDTVLEFVQHAEDQSTSEEERRIANVVVLTGLSQASEHVQIQVLELIRTRRIFTHTAVHAAPKAFVLIIVKSLTDLPLLHHLNDHIFMSHHHSREDGFPNIEDVSKQNEDDQASNSSIIHHSASLGRRAKAGRAIFSDKDISNIRDLVDNISIQVEVKNYLYNVVVFLRMHRAVGGGVSPPATRHLDHLVRCLAPIHGLTFATPPLVGLAAKKVYSHRIRIATPKSERSMQYGSDFATVAELLEEYSAERVIDEVLSEIEIPM